MQLDQAEQRFDADLASIGHAEYPRSLTTAALVESADRLLDLSRLLRMAYLTPELADRDARRLLALRQRAVDAASGDPV